MTSYESAGVNLDAADEVVRRIRTKVTATWNPDVVGGFGGFATGIQIPSGYHTPVLMMSTDGVGTKLEIARKAGILDGIGFDLVAMVADDLVAVGAKPIALTDYIAIGQIDVDIVARIVGSIATACSVSGIALVGGETAEHPGVMGAEQFDVSATALGVVEKGEEIDPVLTKAGDVLIGIGSPNLRSNGFSLVRALISNRLALDDTFPGTQRSTARVILEPSVVYSSAIVDLLTTVTPHGLAHITGGGLPGNVARILPDGTDAVIETARWETPHVFDVLQDLGSVNEDDMYRTFNMGIGFVVVVPETAVDATLSSLAVNNLDANVIGRIIEGTGTVQLL
ncbi:MAG: phosphoribosylformylglycinamidine cyclo-ligase [Actinomycetia bacterium]|nr:phosphoribosylformylglycinamidine cyclo-ligase [Actinomycetes bacterium]